jgi:hypothetical protein
MTTQSKQANNRYKNGNDVYLVGCNARARSYDAKGIPFEEYTKTLPCSYHL